MVMSIDFTLPPNQQKLQKIARDGFMGIAPIGLVLSKFANFELAFVTGAG
jgi:hypothetical protein